MSQVPEVKPIVEVGQPSILPCDDGAENVVSTPLEVPGGGTGSGLKFFGVEGKPGEPLFFAPGAATVEAVTEEETTVKT
ncbi:hypothetical protein AALP_AA1G021800 [Arabis alpina]|uniref:Uncharacterized protein n=1 Tax=Arabis alpina TaxID=50452 RepID=A0A087HKJ1_ARAAL|nr:hypothetical protein AALP_AA1G021800 [Arabis alpina]